MLLEKSPLPITAGADLCYISHSSVTLSHFRQLTRHCQLPLEASTVSSLANDIKRQLHNVKLFEVDEYGWVSQPHDDMLATALVVCQA